MLLKHFVDDRGNLYCFDKDSRDRCVTRRNPKTLFAERNLYSFYDLNGKRDYSTEKHLAEIEDKASPIVNKIVENARIGKLPSLTSDEKDTWVLFFSQLWTRLPSMRDRTASNQLKSERDQQAYRVFKSLPATEPIDSVAMGEFIRKELWPRTIQDPGEMMENVVLPVLRSMSLGVAVTLGDQSAFVIGSNPILRIRRDFDLDHPDIQLWLPLAHDVSVFSFHSEQEMLGNLDDKDIQNFNKDVFEQSTVVAGRSREQIASLAAIGSIP